MGNLAWGRAPQPLTLAGAGSPSVIAGSKDTVGRANGAREVSCLRSRWPKSACHGEQGRGHWSQTSTPGHAFPRTPSPSGPAAPGPLLRGRLSLRTAPESSPGRALPPSPGWGWGRARCHWESCTLTQVCCYYWGRSLGGRGVGGRGRHSQRPGSSQQLRGPPLLPASLPEGQAEGRPPLVSRAFAHSLRHLFWAA